MFVFNTVKIIGSVTMKDTTWDSSKTTLVGNTSLTEMNSKSLNMFTTLSHLTDLCLSFFPKLSSQFETLNGFEYLNVTSLRYCAVHTWSHCFFFIKETFGFNCLTGNLDNGKIVNTSWVENKQKGHLKTSYKRMYVDVTSPMWLEEWGE